MLNGLWNKALSLLLAAVLPGAALAQPSPAAKVEAYMEAHAEVSQFSGAVLVVKGGKVLLRKGYGLADREWGVVNEADTKFRIASLSKTFTAVALLQLVEQGKLALDDRLDKFVPGFPGGDKISVHMMLTHTSGLPHNHDFEVATEMTMTPDKALELIRKKPLEYEPGSKPAYSNTAYFLLSLIIEKLSGKPYGTYMTEHVFRPAGLANTLIHDPLGIVPKRARHYRRTGWGLYAPLENERFWNYAMFQGHGNLISTVDDLYKFAKALQGTSLFSAETRALMFANQLEKFGTTGGYGVGLAPAGKRQMFTHAGRFNGAFAIYTAFPESDSFIALLGNNDLDTFGIYRGLTAILFGEGEVALPYRPVKKTIDRAALARHAGKYDRIEIVHDNGRLMLSDRSPLELVPESETKFFLGNDPNRTFEFVPGPDGRSKAVISTSYGVKTTIVRSE